MMLGWAAAAVAWSAIACDGGGSANRPGAATLAQLRAACGESCARAARCSSSGAPSADAGTSCVARCIDKFGVFETALRADIVQGLERCYASLACGQTDDECATRALLETGDSLDAAIHAPDVEACLAEHVECEATSGVFSDDDCTLLPLLVADRRAALSRCFGGACEGIPECIARGGL